MEAKNNSRSSPSPPPVWFWFLARPLVLLRRRGLLNSPSAHRFVLPDYIKCEYRRVDNSGYLLCTVNCIIYYQLQSTTHNKYPELSLIIINYRTYPVPDRRVLRCKNDRTKVFASGSAAYRGDKTFFSILISTWRRCSKFG